MALASMAPLILPGCDLRHLEAPAGSSRTGRAYSPSTHSALPAASKPHAVEAVAKTSRRRPPRRRRLALVRGTASGTSRTRAVPAPDSRRRPGPPRAVVVWWQRMGRARQARVVQVRRVGVVVAVELILRASAPALPHQPQEGGCWSGVRGGRRAPRPRRQLFRLAPPAALAARRAAAFVHGARGRGGVRVKARALARLRVVSWPASRCNGSATARSRVSVDDPLRPPCRARAPRDGGARRCRRENVKRRRRARCRCRRWISRCGRFWLIAAVIAGHEDGRSAPNAAVRATAIAAASRRRSR